MAKTAQRRAQGVHTPAPVLTPNLSGIPSELKKLPRWVAWRSVPRGEGRKPAKVPINPATGQPDSPTDPSSWGSFATARQRWQKDALAGIGFVFASDGFVGVDLDKCRDPESGKLEPWATAIIREFGTYTEVSPSGTGVKLIARGRLDPNGRRRNGLIEMYDSSRFFALTGHRVPRAPRRVSNCQDAIATLQRSLVPPGRAHPEPVVCSGSFDGPDAELLALAFSARNGERVRSLWEGDKLTHKSFSEALLALARCLAFYTGSDERRLEQLMLGSPLFAASEVERRKWHEMRGTETWGRVYVVRKAIESCSESVLV